MNNSNAVQYLNKLYRPFNSKGIHVIVLRPLDGAIVFLIDNQIYTAVQISKNELVSRECDTLPKKDKKESVPKPPSPDHL